MDPQSVGDEGIAGGAGGFSSEDLARVRALRQRVKSHRERKALTQEEFAKACGLSRSVIANVERGAYLPGLRSRRKIAEALDVPVEELFDPPQTPRG